MRYKTVIFDLDGVIIDTEKLHFECYRQVFEHYGKVLTQEIYDDFFRSKGRKSGVMYFYPNASRDLINEIGLKKDQCFLERIKNGDFDYFEDALCLMETLEKNSIPKAIGTASTKGRNVLEITGLDKRFDVIVTAADVENNKPNPEIYIRCIDELSIDPMDCLIIEDSYSGIQAAIGANANVLFIERPGAPKLNGKKIEYEYLEILSDLRGIDL